MSELKILICDDDPDLQGLLVRRMDKMGVKPDVASDGRTAMNLVNENNYDVIVTDIYMPEATGLEVLQHAKQLDQDTQVVIITSSATLDNAIDALNHGAFGYLTKPFDHLIVFDNMVSRAIEYRHLLVAERRKAEAQKRRGDMLEDEVADRVQQLQKKQKGLLDLLGSLPDGILVVEQGGKVVLSSPVGERWLARDEKSDDRPIHAFISQVHAEMAEPNAEVELDDHELHLMAAEFPNDGEVKRKAVIIREAEDSGVGAGSMVTDTVIGIKKGLATLYEQGLGTEIVLNLANQFAVLEQLSGWTGGTGGLEPAMAAPAPAPPAEPAPQPEAPALAPQAEAPAPDPPAPAPEADPAAAAPRSEAPAADAAQEIDQDPQPTVVNTTPPFMQPRERVNTADLDEPRLNTAELEEALRSAGDQPAEAGPSTPPAESAAPSAPAVEQPAAPGTPAAEEPAAEAPQPSPLSEDTKPAAQVQPEPEPAPAIEEPAAASESAPIPEPPAAAPEAAPVMEQPAATPEDIPEAPQPEAEPIEKPQAPEPAAVPATNGTGELEHPAPEPEPEFPAAQPTGDLDSSVFRPRMIPEEMDAKLETPIELPNTNGKRGLLGRAKGPLKVSSPQADTQMFRRVLAGLSGSEVEGLHGEKEVPPEVKPRPKKAEQPPDPEPTPEPDLSELLDDEPEPEFEPEPEVVSQPVKTQARNWPPKRPSEDPEWDDSLEVTG